MVSYGQYDLESTLYGMSTWRGLVVRSSLVSKHHKSPSHLIFKFNLEYYYYEVLFYCLALFLFLCGKYLLLILPIFYFKL